MYRDVTFTGSVPRTAKPSEQPNDVMNGNREAMLSTFSYALGSHLHVIHTVQNINVSPPLPLITTYPTTLSSTEPITHSIFTSTIYCRCSRQLYHQ